jgi:galactoside O-acetyltransferase
MSYYTEDQLKSMNFGFLGKNVKISDKAVFYHSHLQRIGANSRIDDFVILSGKVELGRNVFIGLQSNLAGGEPGIRIDDFSTLAYGCQIFAQSDDYSGATLTNPTITDKFKSEIKKAVIIEKHCILGTSTIVFPGVNISQGCALGAGSLVLKSTAPWGIYAGTPARRISERKQELLKLEQDYLSEFG